MKPLPEPDDVSRFYWERALDGSLAIQQCGACGNWQHPPDIVCHVCQSNALSGVSVSGNGILFTFSIVHDIVIPEFETPFVVGLVELEEQVGLRVLTNIVSIVPQELRIGMAMHVLFEERGALRIPQFAPARESSVLGLGKK